MAPRTVWYIPAGGRDIVIGNLDKYSPKYGSVKSFAQIGLQTLA